MADFYLYGAPKLLECESTFSWLHRLAQQQGKSFHEIVNFLQIEEIHDADVTSELKFKTMLAPVRQVSASEFELASAINRSIERSVTLRKQIYILGKTNPCSAFCTECLRQDVIPYLRFEWRFKFWKICPVHRMELRLICPYCSNNVILNRALISGKFGAPSLRFCSFCLTDFGAIQNRGDKRNRQNNEKIQMQMNMMKSVVVGYCNIAPIKKPFDLDTMFRLQHLGILQSGTELDFESDSHPDQQRDLIRFIRRANSIRKSNETLPVRAEKWRNKKMQAYASDHGKKLNPNSEFQQVRLIKV